MKTGIAYLAAVLPLAMAESLCDQYAYLSRDGYNFNNNEWGAASGTGDQCTYVDSTSSGGVSWHADWTWSGSESEIKSYPYSGLDLPEKKIVTSIGSISTGAEWSYSGSNIRADVAYDIFTAADPNHATSSGDYEVMIWLANLGGLTPIGSPIGTVKAAGRDWELWDGYNGAMRVYSFVAPSQLNSFDGEIMDFFYVVKDMRGFPADSQHLLTVQFGTEPISGSGAKFSVSHWSAKLG